MQVAEKVYHNRESEEEKEESLRGKKKTTGREGSVFDSLGFEHLGG